MNVSAVRAAIKRADALEGIETRRRLERRERAERENVLAACERLATRDEAEREHAARLAVVREVEAHEAAALAALEDTRRKLRDARAGLEAAEERLGAVNRAAVKVEQFLKRQAAEARRYGEDGAKVAAELGALLPAGVR